MSMSLKYEPSSEPLHIVRQTLNLRRMDLLGPVTRVKNKKKKNPNPQNPKTFKPQPKTLKR